MTASYGTAVDDILTVFKTAWDTTGYVALYENIGGTLPSGNSDPWARLTVRHNAGNLVSLTGGLSTQRYVREGTLFVQIFVPSGESLSEAYSLAELVSTAYEGETTPNGVWFKNVRVNEVGPDGHWFQVNLLIDFTYDEIK